MTEAPQTTIQAHFLIHLKIQYIGIKTLS